MYQDKFDWETGLTVKDHRFAARAANIDISSLVAKSSAADLMDILIKLYHRMPNFNMGKCAIYMNRTVKQMYDIQKRDDVVGSGMKYDEVDGKVKPYRMSDWNTCMRSCVFMKEADAFMHDVVLGTVATTGIFNSFFRTMDDAFGYGKDRDPSEWWDSDLLAFGINTSGRDKP